MISFNAKKLLIPMLAVILAKNVYTPILVRTDTDTESTFAYSSAASNQDC